MDWHYICQHVYTEIICTEACKLGTRVLSQQRDCAEGAELPYHPHHRPALGAAGSQRAWQQPYRQCCHPRITPATEPKPAWKTSCRFGEPLLWHVQSIPPFRRASRLYQRWAGSSGGHRELPGRAWTQSQLLGDGVSDQKVTGILCKAHVTSCDFI